MEQKLHCKKCNAILDYFINGLSVLDYFISGLNNTYFYCKKCLKIYKYDLKPAEPVINSFYKGLIKERLEKREKRDLNFFKLRCLGIPKIYVHKRKIIKEVKCHKIMDYFIANSKIYFYCKDKKCRTVLEWKDDMLEECEISQPQYEGIVDYI